MQATKNVHKLKNLQQEPSECDRIKKKKRFCVIFNNQYYFIQFIEKVK